MKALLLTHGTRGDVQPFLALARALDAAGHTAVVAGPAAAAPLAADHGVAYRPVDDGPNTLMGDPELSGIMDTGLRGVRGAVQAATLVRRITPLMRRVYADMAEAAADGADLVVHLPGMPGHHIAERLGVPSVPVALQPSWVPTGAFPAPGLPWPDRLPPMFNRASYLLLAVALRGQYSVAEELRERLGLDRRPHRHDPLRRADGSPRTLLQAFSRHLLPAGTGYPPNVHTTGFWFPPAQEWSPPSGLAAFLDAGEPPVFIGFSSLPSADPERTGHLMADVVRAAGTRAVVATGWGGIDARTPLGDDVHVIDQAPHAWLFPRCAAVVHHGGGGTTGAALAAGRPQVICPFWGDQPFWARRAHAAGAATAPQRGQRLTADALAAAITRATTDPLLIDTARALGERVRAEDGVHYAVDALERIGATRPRQP